MNKKIVIVISTIIIIIAGLIFFFIKKNQTRNLPPIKVTQISSQGIQKISAEKVLFPVLSSDGKSFLFFSDSQTPAFYKMDIDGKNTDKISDPLDTPEDVIWSPDRSKVILKVIYNQYVFEKYGSRFAAPGTPDGAETTWTLDIASNKIFKLDDHIKNILWSKDNKIVYQLLDADQSTNTLNIANPGGSSTKKITDLPDLNDYGLSFVNDNKNLIIYTLPTDTSNSIIYTLNLDEKTLNKVKEVTGATQAQGLNNRIIFTIPNKKTPQLTLIDLDGTNEKKLGVGGFLYKLTISDDSLYLAARGSGRQTDDFYKINLQSNKIAQINYITEDKVDAQNLVVSDDGKFLYFTSDNILYKLGL